MIFVTTEEVTGPSDRDHRADSELSWAIIAYGVLAVARGHRVATGKKPMSASSIPRRAS